MAEVTNAPCALVLWQSVVPILAQILSQVAAAVRRFHSSVGVDASRSRTAWQSIASMPTRLLLPDWHWSNPVGTFACRWNLSAGNTRQNQSGRECPLCTPRPNENESLGLCCSVTTTPHDTAGDCICQQRMKAPLRLFPRRAGSRTFRLLFCRRPSVSRTRFSLFQRLRHPLNSLGQGFGLLLARSR